MIFSVYAWRDGGPVYRTANIKKNDSTSERNILEDDNNSDVVFNAGQIHLELNDENVDPPHANEQQYQNRGNFRRLSEGDELEDENDFIEPKIISEEELLHKYWKLVVSIKVGLTGRKNPNIFWEGANGTVLF